jgi:hypothetical protein
MSAEARAMKRQATDEALWHGEQLDGGLSRKQCWQQRSLGCYVL